MLVKAYCYRAQLSSYANYDKIMRKIHDASYILDNGMLTANTEQAAFMRRYFTDAWERALA